MSAAYRLLAFFVIALGFQCAAYAAPPVTAYWINGSPQKYPSAAAACAYSLGTDSVVVISTNGQPSGCLFTRTTGSQYGATLNVLPDGICPTGAAPDKTKPLAAQCPDPEPTNCSDKNPFVRKFLFGSGSAAASLPSAVGGCAVSVRDVLVCRTETISGITSTYCMLELVRTGATADNPTGQAPSTSDPDNPADPKVQSPPLTPTGSQCPSGTVQVGSTASGTPMCVGGGSAPGAPSNGPSTTTGPVQTTTSPDGSTVATQTVSKTNADGSVTTTTTTTKTAPDGTKTVSQSGSTSANAAGGAGVSENPEDQNFCKQNPMLNVCRNSTVNGTCGEVTSNGDAIACATLRAAAASECRSKALEDDLKKSELTTLGNAAIGGNDPMKSQFPTAQNGQVVQGPSSLDSSGWLGGGSCFADKSVALLGRVIVLPFSQVCQYLIGLRYALMVVAAIFSFKILSGAILNR